MLPGVTSLLGTWEGYITVPTNGTYYFAASVGSDDRVDVTVGTTLVLRVNDGTTKSAVALDAPKLEAAAAYFARPNVTAGSAGVALTAAVPTKISISYRNPAGDGNIA